MHRIAWIALITFGAVLLISWLSAPWQEAITAAFAVALGLYVWDMTGGRSGR